MLRSMGQLVFQNGNLHWFDIPTCTLIGSELNAHSGAINQIVALRGPSDVGDNEAAGDVSRNRISERVYNLQR